MAHEEMANGMTILSISPSVPLITPSTDLSKTWFLVEVALTGGLEKIVGTISKDDFEAYTGYKTKFPLEIGVSSIAEIARYPIVNEGLPIYKYISEQKTAPKGDCYTLLAYGYSVGYNDMVNTYDWVHCSNPTLEKNPVNSCVCHQLPFNCINRIQEGVKGRIESPTISFEGVIDVLYSNKSYSKTVSSFAQSVSFKDSADNLVVMATWVGSLITGNPPPDPSGYVSVHALRNGLSEWRIANDPSWDDYNMLNKLAERALDTASGYADAISDVNASADVLLAESVAIGQSPLDIVTPESLEASSIEIDLQNRVTIPTVRFKIRADQLGVVMPYGMPEIISVPDTVSLTSGESAGVEVEVKNTSEYDGSFVVVLVSGEKISQRYIPSPVTIPAGATKTLTMTVDAGTITEYTITEMDIRVYDYSMPENEDTTTISVTIQKPKICAPGKIRTTALCADKCSEDGSIWDKMFCCDTHIEVTLAEGISVIVYVGNYPEYHKEYTKNSGWHCHRILFSAGRLPYSLFEQDGIVWRVDSSPTHPVIVAGEDVIVAFSASAVGDKSLLTGMDILTAPALDLPSVTPGDLASVEEKLKQAKTFDEFKTLYDGLSLGEWTAVNDKYGSQGYEEYAARLGIISEEDVKIVPERELTDEEADVLIDSLREAKNLGELIDMLGPENMTVLEVEAVFRRTETHTTVELARYLDIPIEEAAVLPLAEIGVGAVAVGGVAAAYMLLRR